MKGPVKAQHHQHHRRHIPPPLDKEKEEHKQFNSRNYLHLYHHAYYLPPYTYISGEMDRFLYSLPPLN